MPADPRIGLCTVPDQDTATRIAEALVTEQLAACVNIIDHVNSIYWWNGEIQDDQEVVLIAKTRASLVPRLIEKTKSVHSYECPCIVSLPILDGNQAFLDWIQNETANPAKG